MKIDGAPLITMGLSQAQDEPDVPGITDEDRLLLEHIETGQLKLSPCHQVRATPNHLIH